MKRITAAALTSAALLTAVAAPASAATITTTRGSGFGTGVGSPITLPAGYQGPADTVAQPVADLPRLASGESVRDTGWITRVTDGDTFRFVSDSSPQAQRVSAAAASSQTKRLGDQLDGGRSYYGNHNANYQIVRLIGVQAPEVSRHAMAEGGCGGDDAQRALVSKAEGYRVVLASGSNSVDTKRGRIQRTAYVQNPDGTWTDLAAYMLSSGWGQWFPKTKEPVHNLEYRRLTDNAIAQGRNLWNPSHCGIQYAADGRNLQLQVEYDPFRDERSNPNTEQVVIRNAGSTPVNLNGWVLRNGSLSWLKFTSDATIAPQKSLTVKVGKGKNTADTVYWGWNRPVFTNPVTTPSRYMGGGAYLIDPAGNIQVKTLYPRA